MKRFALVALQMILLQSWAVMAQDSWRGPSFLRYDRDQEASTAPITLATGTYAVFHTSDGEFIARLFTKEAPKAVENFVALAAGKKRWTHPITRAESDQPLYNNTTIYEIVKDIVIRGGDPINKGTGGPGYVQELETPANLAFDTPGVLAMQNDGSKASGSRWFISLSPFPDWSKRYTIVGKIIGGMDVIRDISGRPTKRPFIPLEPTLVNSIEIVEVPEGQETTARFSVEDGRKVLTIDKDYRDVVLSMPDPSDTATSATDGQTSGAAVTTGTAETTAPTNKQ